MKFVMREYVEGCVVLCVLGVCSGAVCAGDMCTDCVFGEEA